MKRYFTALLLSFLVGGCCAGRHQGHAGNWLSSKEVADAEILRISAEVDGSGFFEFTPFTVSYQHLNWQPPTEVSFNGAPWGDLDQTPQIWKDNGRGLDLSRARIVERKGRDVIALERTEAGFDLYLSDSPNGADRYEVTIVIPRRK